MHTAWTGKTIPAVCTVYILRTGNARRTASGQTHQEEPVPSARLVCSVAVLQLPTHTRARARLRPRSTSFRAFSRRPFFAGIPFIKFLDQPGYLEKLQDAALRMVYFTQCLLLFFFLSFLSIEDEGAITSARKMVTPWRFLKACGYSFFSFFKLVLVLGAVQGFHNSSETQRLRATFNPTKDNH